MSSPSPPAEVTMTESGCNLRHLHGTGRATVLSPLPQNYSGSRHQPPASASSPAASSTRSSFQLPTQSTSPNTPTRQRRQSPSAYWPLSRNGEGLTVPNEWGQDTINFDEEVDAITSLVDFGGEDDQFLDALAQTEFSSPSSYPSFTLDLPTNEATLLDQPEQADVINPGLTPLRTTPDHRRPLAATLRSTSRLSSSSVGESQNTLLTDNDTEEPSQSSNSSFSDKMPPPPRHSPLANNPSPQTNKRRKTSKTSDKPDLKTLQSVVAPAEAPLAMPTVPDDDLFGDSIIAQTTGTEDEELAAIDLTEATEVPEDLTTAKVDNRTKIAKFQCVICMDDATTLTLTHCGHLYCAQCLHSSLHVEATKGKCPMCRAKIDMKPRNSYSNKTKGFFPLELKLMTATRKGKRKANEMSSQ